MVAASARHALAVLDLVIDRQPGALSKPLFDAAISTCCAQYLAPEALRVYERMASCGFAPTLRSCNMALAACSHGGDVKAVMAILDDMEARGVAPNDFTAVSALQACMFKRAGRHEDAVSIVTQLTASTGASPSAEVADALLSVCEASMEKSPGALGKVCHGSGGG